MRKHSEIIKAANELYAVVSGNFDEYGKVKADCVKALATMPYEEAHGVVDGLIDGARALVAGSFSEDGTTFPKYLTSFKTFDEAGKLTKVVITIKSKLKDAVKYKKEVEIMVDDDFMKNFTDAHITAIFDMYYRTEANNNLTEVNKLIEEICQKNNIPYTFGFALGDGKEYITYIDNDKVIFNANLEEALEVSKQGLFLSGDDYFDLVREQQTEKLVETLSVTHTTVQLIKAKVDIINTLIGYTTKKRADRLIRGTYHKKAEYFNKTKSGFGYYEGTVGDTEVFAILEKHEDGTITVALNPFDIKTMLNVDIDVVAEVNKLLA